MALIVADRVLETSSTTGTGALTLAAAVTGYRRFSSVCATNDTCYYTIFAVDSNGNPSGDWECGLGTYSSANTLTRTTPQASTNSNNAVNFGVGTKYVFLGATAAYLATLGAVRTIAFFFTTTPTASEVLGIYPAVEAFTIPANLSGTQAAKLGSGGVNPAATFAIDVKQNGTSIATISISTGGAVTLTTTSGTAKSVAAGDLISFHGPGSADSSIANWGFNVKGVL